MTDIVVLIPAFEPDKRLVSLVDDLISLNFDNIVIIDDGSSDISRPFLRKLEAVKGCHVLRHVVNLGKGRAIKTGLNFVCATYPDARGVITVDADGQHLPRDIVRVVDTFLRNPSKLVVGSRRFGAGTPLRSLIGNIITRYVFRFLVGKNISDTQSGLRCFPMSAVPDLIRLAGERYDYEMNMLISTKRSHTGIIEEEISTVYIQDNHSSHFNPLIDSMKIYFLLLRFSFSSMLASLIDFAVFTVTFYVTSSILTSIVTARIVSANINFMVNRKLVFHSERGIVLTMAKFYVATFFIGWLAFFMINSLSRTFGMNVILAKAFTETILFFFGFLVQRDFIFRASEE